MSYCGSAMFLPLQNVTFRARPDSPRRADTFARWAQVNDLRGDSDIAKRIQYDRYDTDNWSLRFVAHILAVTVFHRLRGAQRAPSRSSKNGRVR